MEGLALMVDDFDIIDKPPGESRTGPHMQNTDRDKRKEVLPKTILRSHSRWEAGVSLVSHGLRVDYS
jgi:hypothetical protein